MDIPFSKANAGRDFGWRLAGQPFGAGPIPVSLYESCSWPPPPGADATGYSRILVSTVPGDRQWLGEIDPTAFANVLDTSCRKILINYTGGHTGVSFSRTVRISAGELLILYSKAMNPGEPKPKTVSSWAYTVGYYINPGETVVLHPDILSNILSVTCIS
jgi:hypothetical protein